ncbi:MAG: 4-hydroxy-tetrahydrodipicolinate synthase [Chlamydiota bacterium]
MQLGGVMTALVTPFTAHGQIDEEVLRSQVRFQLKQRIDGLVVLGTTGEGATLTATESARVVACVLEEVDAKIPVVVYVGDNATERAVAKARQAQEWGANALLVITPYYNRPPQAGLIAHFEAVARQTALPLILYHHPKRTGVSLSRDTLAHLAKIDAIIGIKEGTGNVRLAAEFLDLLPADFLFFSGDDLVTLPLLSLGAHGVISVVSNLVPGPMRRLVAAARAGDGATARKWHRALFPFFQAATVETNPIPIKAMLAFAGRGEKTCRLPLTSLATEHAAKLQALVDTELPVVEVAHG